MSFDFFVLPNHTFDKSAKILYEIFSEFSLKSELKLYTHNLSNFVSFQGIRLLHKPSRLEKKRIYVFIFY